jgi:hypothetical protein
MMIRFKGHRPRDLALGRATITMHPGDEFEVPPQGAVLLLDQPRWYEPADDQAQQLLDEMQAQKDQEVSA